MQQVSGKDSQQKLALYYEDEQKGNKQKRYLSPAYLWAAALDL